MEIPNDWLNTFDTPLLDRLHRQSEDDPYKNKIHLSAYSGVTGVPATLFYHKENYYIVLENGPFNEYESDIMSWVMFTTKNFVSYKYHGIMITPSLRYDKDGILAGSFHFEGASLYFYYSGLVHYGENKTTTFVLKANVNFRNHRVNKQMLFGGDKSLYKKEQHPEVIKFDDLTYMLLGAETKHNKAVFSVYHNYHHHFNRWQHIKSLSWGDLDKMQFHELQSPNLVNLVDEKALIFSAIQRRTRATGLASSWFQNGHFDRNFNFHPHNAMNRLDYGLDFFGAKTFKNDGHNIKMMALLGNPLTNPPMTNSLGWKKQLTLPRHITFKSGVLQQMPIPQLEELRMGSLVAKNRKLTYKNCLAEVYFDEIEATDFKIKISNAENHALKLHYHNQILSIDRTDATLHHEHHLPGRQTVNIPRLSNIALFLDSSCLEIFVNDGQYAISVNFFVKHHHQISWTNLRSVEAYQLKPIKITWENKIFDNTQKQSSWLKKGRRH